jgi:hypothetical protein
VGFAAQEISFWKLTQFEVVPGSIWTDRSMGSNFMPRSISLYRGIARFSSTHLDCGILHNANDRSKIAGGFFYRFVRCHK